MAVPACHMSRLAAANTNTAGSRHEVAGRRAWTSTSTRCTTPDTTARRGSPRPLHLGLDAPLIPICNQADRSIFLPGVRRRLYLDALLASQEDPVLAVDGDGVVVVANAAAVAASRLPEAQLVGTSLQLLLGDANHIPHDPPVLSEKITVEVR